MESIKELRTICQATRESEIYQMNWFDRHVLRALSIYVTKLCLKLGVSANQVTLFDFLMVLAAGAFFTFAGPGYWLMGILFFYLYMQIDCSDGEIARYNKAKSGKPASPFGVGAVLGGIVDWLTWPILFACMSFGIYDATGSVLAFIPGFAAAVLRLVYIDISIMPYPILHEAGLLEKSLKEIEGEVLQEAKLLGFGRALFGVQGFLPVIILVTTIDWFAPLWTVGALTFNARLIYLTVFGLAALAGILVRTADIFRHGARITRI